jgi:AroM protein.
MVTIGQAPRTDVAPFMERFLGDRVSLVQAGVLDGLTKEYIVDHLYPEQGDYVLTSRLTNGEYVVMSREKIQPLLQRRIDAMEEAGIKQILLLCTGVFPGLTTRTAYLIEPDRIIPPTVKAIAGRRRLGVIIPLAAQQDNIKTKYAPYGMAPLFACASPYKDDNLPAAAQALKDKVDLILLDCMGYTEPMRDIAAAASGLPVILSNTLMAKLVSEMV